MESAERLKCTQIGLLNDILRILFIMEQPSRQVVRGVHVGQHQLFKRRQCVFLSMLFLMLLKYDKLHNLGTRLEILSVKSIFGFQCCGHTIFDQSPRLETVFDASVVTRGRKLLGWVINDCIHLIQPAQIHFYSQVSKKDWRIEASASRHAKKSLL